MPFSLCINFFCIIKYLSFMYMYCRYGLLNKRVNNFYALQAKITVYFFDILLRDMQYWELYISFIISYLSFW